MASRISMKFWTAYTAVAPNRDTADSFSVILQAFPLPKSHSVCQDLKALQSKLFPAGD